MKKESFKYMLLIVCLLSSITASAYNFESNGIYYKITSQKDKTVAVTYQNEDDNFYSGSVVIPASVTNDGTTYSVTSIGERAFNDDLGLTSVTIPNSVTKIALYAFDGCEGLTNVTIPNSVTEIGEYAFNGCSSLTSVNIPNSVTEIGGFALERTQWYESQADGVVYAGLVAYKYKGDMPSGTSITIKEGIKTIGDCAFERCSGLASIKIPNSVTSIGESAFHSCPSLSSVTISNSVTKIGEEAFAYCDGLTSVSISRSLTSIGKRTFSGCSGLKKFIVDSENSNYSALDGVLFNKDKTIIVLYPNAKSPIYAIPNSVTKIGEDAFYYCTGLTNVTIPNSVTSIGETAFAGCDRMESVEIPNSVTSIGGGAFSDCGGLTSIPNSVTEIGLSAFENTPWDENQTDGLVYAGLVAYRYKGDMPSGTSITIKEGTKMISDCAFYDYTDLTSVTIPNSVTSIGDCAFFDCTSLTRVTIPNSVTEIGPSAFFNCQSLTSVTIGNSVTFFHENPFYGSKSLKKFIVDSGNNNYTVIDGVLFNKDETTIVAYPNAKSPKYTIPNSVTSIGKFAFSDCEDLTSVTIPNSVTSIAEFAFSGRTYLKKIYNYSKSPQNIDINTFGEVDKKTCILYVPKGTVEAYRASDYWRNFLNIKEFQP